MARAMVLPWCAMPWATARAVGPTHGLPGIGMTGHILPRQAVASSTDFNGQPRLATDTAVAFR